MRTRSVLVLNNVPPYVILFILGFCAAFFSTLLIDEHWLRHAAALSVLILLLMTVSLLQLFYLRPPGAGRHHHKVPPKYAPWFRLSRTRCLFIAAWLQYYLLLLGLYLIQLYDGGDRYSSTAFDTITIASMDAVTFMLLMGLITHCSFNPEFFKNGHEYKAKKHLSFFGKMRHLLLKNLPSSLVFVGILYWFGLYG